MENLYVFAVVPHAGTWIEIMYHQDTDHLQKSFLTRERGLKYIWWGIWESGWCRSPCGNVDWNIIKTTNNGDGFCRSPRGKNQVQQEKIILILVWRRKIDTKRTWIILESHIKEDKLKARDGGKAVAIRWEYSKRFVLWHLKMSMMNRF